MDREGPMPDADDFDVEYFRALLKGNRPPEGGVPPAATPRPAAKKAARRAAKPAAATAKSAPAAGRKKGSKR